MTLEEENLQHKARNQFLENQVALLLPFKDKSEQLETVVNQLLERVQKLEQQLKTNSRNSSKPPSSDSFNRPPKNRSLRQKSGKSTGGQPDQQGHQLALTDQPDQIVRYLPQHCHNCQASLTDLAATQLRLKEQRQVWDVPPLKVQVTEHQTLECVCPHYAWHSKRGKTATDAIGILVNYRGISVHDGFTSYPQYQCDHALCNAHHLRELIFVKEQLGQGWAGDFMALLLELKEAVRAAREAGAVALLPEQLATYYQRYDQLIACGLEANPPPIAETVAVKQGRPKQTKAKNLLDRLQKHRAEVLRFATNFAVPFDNNQAERDLRKLRVQQKISGSFRSAEGADYFCRIRSYISTMRKQGQSIFKVLRSAFNGQVILPAVGV